MAVTTALLPVVFGMFKDAHTSMDLGYFSSIASIVAILSPILGSIAGLLVFVTFAKGPKAVPLKN